MRHFLKLGDRSSAAYTQLFARTHELKSRRRRGLHDDTLRGKTLVLLFEKASTRTRLSFEAAMFQLGGACIDLPMSQSQLNRGEPLTDTAKVIAGYADALVFRTHGDDRLAAYADASRIPVINGLSDGGHPVQLLADLFTIEEKLGSVKGTTIAFIGDGATNMGLSFIEAAPIFGFHLRLAAPIGYQPAAINDHVFLTTDPRVAVAGADVVVTDVWTSMGQEAETAARLAAFAGFQVDADLMKLAKPTAIVLHCLPAHRGEEISAEVIDGPQSVVFEEAENRMHVQKALLEETIRNPTLLSEFTWDAEHPPLKKSILDALTADAIAWGEVVNQAAKLAINKQPSAEVFGMTRTGTTRTVVAAQWLQLWHYAQSGSDRGEYHFRIVEVTFAGGKQTAERVLGEIKREVTERGDEDFDVDGEFRAFRDATLSKLGMR
ncbi:MAG: ornithine carbamoyltransferase [Proteobacteria bacterium]|nr:ornithine carbamoyltransferase [Pseudomonadota bacterium]